MTRPPERTPVARHAVILPFYNRLPMVERCVSLLLEQALEGTRIVLVDDGSTPPAADDPAMARLLADARVVLLRHAVNRGVAAARNTALAWCRQAGTEIVLMIDSDCEPSSDFIREHLRLHADDAAATCILGAIDGVGEGFWARLDRVMTWVHPTPDRSTREIEHPYHMVTTNLSAKLASLPPRYAVFDPRLRTGEDALLTRELRHAGHRLVRSPTPRAIHRDRETFRGLLWHHYQYGHHHYFVQLGRDLSPRCFHPVYRAAFVLAFAPCVPLFALAGSILNVAPWLRQRPSYVLFYPLMYLLWLAKGIAVIESAVTPWRTLRDPGPDPAADEMSEHPAQRAASGASDRM
jgi:glycosyltransferase involved in cell wall biosynthesis